MKCDLVISCSILKIFSGLLLLLAWISSLHAQIINPNKLKPCPVPDMAKSNDLERLIAWDRCWGRYRIESDLHQKGYLKEGEWLSGRQHGVGRHIFPNGKYVGEFKHGLRHGRGEETAASGDKYPVVS